MSEAHDIPPGACSICGEALPPVKRAPLPGRVFVHGRCGQRDDVEILEVASDTPPVDGRDPAPCPKCGEVCTYDGWGRLVHASGVGIGSCDTPPAECCCESSPPELGGNLPDRECPLHGERVTPPGSGDADA